MRRRALPFLLFLLLTVPFTQAQTKLVWTDIEHLPGWESCGGVDCAGGANDAEVFTGPTIVSSPALDGTGSAEFFLDPQGKPHVDALWWKQVLGGAADAAKIAPLRSFLYELYFYVGDTKVPQALEFDVNQTICNDCATAATNSTRYIFGTECNLAQTGTWRIWDNPKKTWADTRIRCAIQPFKWNSLVLEFQHTADNRVRYISITLNGKKSYVNVKQPPTPIPAPADDLNPAFQMDANAAGTAFSVWLDKVKLTAW